MSVHFSNLYGIFKNSSYHVSKEKTSAQRQKRKKPLLGRPISTRNLLSFTGGGFEKSRPPLSFCHSQQLKAWRPTGGRRHAVLLSLYLHIQIHMRTTANIGNRQTSMPVLTTAIPFAPAIRTFIISRSPSTKAAGQ